MADPITTYNNLAADPEFIKLAPEEQKAILQRVKGPSAAVAPSGSAANPNEKLQTGGGLLTGTGITGSAGHTAVSPGTSDFTIDMLRPMLAGAGATAGSIAGPVGSIAGYTGIDALLQHLKQNKDRGMVASATGMEPGGAAATLTNTAEQFGLGKLGEKVLGAAGRGIKTLLNPTEDAFSRLTPTTSQVFEKTGYSKLAHVTGALEDISVSNKNKALDRIAGKGFAEALDVAKKSDLNFTRNPQLALEDISSQMNPQAGSGPLGNALNMGKPAAAPLTFSALDNVISDPSKLQSTLTRASELGTGENLKKSLAGYQFMKVFNNATTRKVGENVYNDNVVRINPQSIADEWLDPKMQDSFKLLYNKEQRANIGEFFKNLAITQEKVGSGTPRKLWMMQGGVGIGVGLLTGSPIVGGAGGAAGLYVGAQALSRLLTNPKTARLALALAGGEPLGVSEQFAGRQLARALQGTTVALINNDGSKSPATFDPSGKLTVEGQ